mmetsp:Transcript_4301/g.7385  ORF Transcript_4301/g.7385 Transcript_4301/m.7385 type:complete len:94 (-) Transcript_4301:137-418(-)
MILRTSFWRKILTVWFVVDCLCIFARFDLRPQYVEATRLIREQALEEPSILKIESRFGIQLWHVLVTILLWASISETYTANAIRTFVTDLFTF